ncbi:hypothetical protein HQ529_02120 [Candidatus Woesearchaeota archaeon]|nr:hypothetical protein [Candidatus Woesearchaeota archaeon]
MGVYWDRVRRHFNFSVAEVRDVVIAILVMTLIFGFNDGRENFVAYLWITNIIKVLFIVMISVALHVCMQKLVGLISSYKAEFRIWPYGVVIGLLLTIVSSGKLYFLAPGGVLIHHMTLHRLGMFRYGLSTYLSTIIAFSGPLSNIILALIFKILYFSTNIEIFSIIVVFNLWYAVFSMLPVPPLDGSTAFFGGRSTYALFFSFIIAASIMIAISSTLVVMLFGSLFLSVFFWFIYYLAIERHMM